MHIIDPHPPEAHDTAASAFPLDRTDDDPRFSLGVVLDVAELLAARGYPPVATGGDIVALRQALYGVTGGAL